MSDLVKDLLELVADMDDECDGENYAPGWAEEVRVAAREIERLRGLLREIRKSVPIDAFEAVQCAAKIDAALAGTAVQPEAARPELVLTGAQILDLYEMCGGEFDDTEWLVYRTDAFTAKSDTDGDPDEPMPAGVYAILHEYPEEGFIGPLGVTPDQQSEVQP